MTDFSASFVARSLPALLDGAHVRASNGTDTGLDGILSTVSSNVPAFDRDRGVVLGAVATQLLYNTGFAGAVSGTPGTLPTSWSRGNGGAGGTKEVIAIDLGNAIRFTTVGNSDREFIQQSVSCVSGTSYDGSVVVVVETSGSKYQDWISVVTGTGTLGSISYYVDGAVAGAADVLSIGTHVLEYRFSCTGTGTLTLRCGAGVNGGVVGGCAGVVKYPQFEAGSFRTSYIYNTSTSAALLREPAYITSSLSALGVASQVNEYTIAACVRMAVNASVAPGVWTSLITLGRSTDRVDEVSIIWSNTGSIYASKGSSASYAGPTATGATWSALTPIIVALSVSNTTGMILRVGSMVVSDTSANAKLAFTSAATHVRLHGLLSGSDSGSSPASYLGALIADRAYSQAELEALDASMFDPVVTLDGITYPATVTGSNQVSITVAGIGEFDAAGDHAATPWYENVPVTLAIGDESASSTLQVVAPVPGNFGTAGASPVYPPVGLDIGDDVYVDKVSGAGTADPEGVDYSAATSSVVRFRAFNQNSALWLAYREESFAVGGIVMAIVRPVVKSVVEAIT